MLTPFPYFWVVKMTVFYPHEWEWTLIKCDRINMNQPVWGRWSEHGGCTKNLWQMFKNHDEPLDLGWMNPLNQGFWTMGSLGTIHQYPPIACSISCWFTEGCWLSSMGYGGLGTLKPLKCSMDQVYLDVPTSGKSQLNSLAAKVRSMPIW